MTEPQDGPRELDRTVTPPAGAPAEPDDASDRPREAAEPTIGTGTSIALGCVAGTVLLIVIGLLFLLAVMLLG